MLAPRLRHRIDLQIKSTTVDSNYGGETDSWSNLATSVAAEILPLSGREFVAAQAIQSGVTSKVTIRYRNGLTAAMRIVHGSDIYDIKAVLPDPTLSRHITFLCEVGVNNG